MKLTQKFIFLLAFAGLIIGCAQAPESDDAKTGEAEDIEQPEEETSMTYALDTDESNILWVATKPTGRHNGTIDISQGQFMVEDGEIKGGKITIDMSTVFVEDLVDSPEDKAKLEKHLKSDDFFHVDSIPTASFEVAEVMPYQAPAETEEEASTEEGEEENQYKIENPTHTIRGNLTLKGVTKSVEFPAKVSMQDGTMTAEARFNIDRTNWGISYMEEGSAQDKFIHNTVNVGFDLKASSASM